MIRKFHQKRNFPLEKSSICQIICMVYSRWGVSSTICHWWYVRWLVRHFEYGSIIFPIYDPPTRSLLTPIFVEFDFDPHFRVIMVFLVPHFRRISIFCYLCVYNFSIFLGPFWSGIIALAPSIPTNMIQNSNEYPTFAGVYSNEIREHENIDE